MASVKRPEVDVVTTADSKQHVVISRGKDTASAKAKSFEIRGSTEREKIKNIVEDIINDPRTPEWLPR